MGLKNDPTIYYLQGTHFKVGFKSVKVKRSKARHYILIKSSI